jgi:multicomponent Na+:H+ antiporter subunit G
MSASTKTATLGVGSILLAAAIYFNELGVASRAIATVFFVLLTAPVAAHMVARAAYFNGVPLWSDTRYNELKGRFDIETHTLVGSEDSSDAGLPQEQNGSL